MAASAIFALNSCTEDTPGEELDGPSIEWKSNSDFSTVDITETMDVNLTIKAPAGIKSFTVDVKSDALEQVLGAISSNGSTLDLINDTKLIEGLKTMASMEGYEGLADLPTGDAILNQTSIDFNISSLVPLILLLTQNDTEESLHEFTINVTDNNAKTATETCTFRRVASDTPSYAAPTMTWEGNENFDVEEIEEGMSVKLSIDVPAGIESLVVDINSAPLNLMGMTTIDFVNPGDMQSIVDMILSGQDITTVTSLTLDLSNLVPMLLMLPTLTPDSDHVFTVKLTDKAGQDLEQACTFHYTGPQYAAPAITWEGNESFGPMEIEEGMSVKLSIDVPAGIESLVVDINSAPLNSMGMTTIDFVNPGDLQTVVDMVLSGQDITTATSLTLDLSSLVPMLLILPTITPDSDHVFTVKLTDKAGQGLEQACTFHYTGE